MMTLTSPHPNSMHWSYLCQVHDPEQFEAVVERIRSGGISRRRAAQELAIGYATLKRLLDTLPQPSDDNGTSTPTHSDKEVLFYAHASPLTESLTTYP